jgi:hypothetical protein
LVFLLILFLLLVYLSLVLYGQGCCCPLRKDYQSTDNRQ